MEYRVYKHTGRSQGGGVLSNSGTDGLVLCAKEHRPFPGYGVYNIVHTGRDKNLNFFSIAVPVLYLVGEDIVTVCKAAEVSHTWPESIFCQRLQASYPDADCSDFFSLVELIRLHGEEEVAATALTPQNCDDECFWVDRDCCTEDKLKPNSHVAITYGNGRREIRAASWVYKHRDKLVDTGITVFGKTADVLRLSFFRIS